MNGEGDVAKAVNALVDEYRARCLWFLRPDYYPRSVEERLKVLDSIACHGDREAYRKATTIRRWLLHHSSAGSAVS